MVKMISHIFLMGFLLHSEAPIYPLTHKYGIRVSKFLEEAINRDKENKI